MTRVDQPLVLIAQTGRSGGSLLMRLFDAHPQLHAVPHELGTLFPRRAALLAGTRVAWRGLHDPALERRFLEGYRQVKPALHGDRQVFPFVLPPTLHRVLFERLAADARDERAVVDAYMTAYFNAWLDYSGLEGQKRWVTGFEPGAIANNQAIERVRELYPDGRLISLLRDPWTWWASARKWSSRWSDPDAALGEWRAGVEAALQWRDRIGPAFALLAFDELVGRPEAAMRRLAAWLGIAWDDTLLQPTFNGTPIRGNSSFDSGDARVSDTPLGRRAQLDAGEQRLVDRLAGTVWREARELVTAED